MRGLDDLEAIMGRPSAVGPTIAEFFERPSLWLRIGASDSRRLSGTRATKFSTYAASTSAQLHTDIYDPSSPHYKIFDKRERGKHRNLISSPWSLFLQMSFVGIQAEKRFKEVVPTSLSRDWQPENWLEIMGVMRRKLFVPIDQSKFDHVPSMRVLERCVEILCKAGTCPTDAERSQISLLILDRIKHGSLSYSGKSYQHLRGLLSGWRWTSLIGTMVNYAEYLAIYKQVGIRQQPDTHVCFQGDDALIAVDDWADAVRIVRRYMEVLPVNPSKFFIDNRRSEYLRYIITKQRRYGYYARAAAGIMYSNAWAGGAMDPASMASNWSLLYSRGAQAKATLYGCARDICGLLRCKVSDALNLIQTPATVGGLGWHVEGHTPSAWVRVSEVKRSLIGRERLIVTTGYDDLEKATRMEMSAAASQRGYSRPMARVVNKSLSGGLVTTKQQDRPKQTTEAVDRHKLYIYSRAYSHTTPPQPTSRIDPIYVNEAIRSLDSKDGLEWGDVFDIRDVNWLKARKKNWGAKMFNQWASGQLTGFAGKIWGDAPDFLARVRDAVDSEGILPSGRKSMWRLTNRLLELELTSRHWLTDMRKRLGA
jgi:hypothetical protein